MSNILDFIMLPDNWYFQALKRFDQEEEKYLESINMTREEYINFLNSIPIQCKQRYSMGYKS
jgi:nicotinic acid phosphoribosyltransferase